MASGTGLLKTLDFTPAISTDIYASGDILFIPTELKDVFSRDGGNVALNTVWMLDEDDNAAQDIDLLFFDATLTLDALNAALTALTDAEAETLIAFYKVDSTSSTVLTFDALDSTVWMESGLAIQMQAAADSTSLWICGITRDAYTYTAATNLKFKFGFTQD